jgi:hypothetical protein
VNGFVYKCQDHNDRGDDYAGDFIRIAIVQVDEKKLHSGEDRKYNHIIYLKDLSFINLRVCEKCNLYVYQMGRYLNKGDNPNYYAHVKNCNGKKKEKRLMVSYVELPICPGMMYENTWMYLKSHDLLHLWKPDI